MRLRCRTSCHATQAVYHQDAHDCAAFAAPAVPRDPAAAGPASATPRTRPRPRFCAARAAISPIRTAPLMVAVAALHAMITVFTTPPRQHDNPLSERVPSLLLRATLIAETQNGSSRRGPQMASTFCTYMVTARRHVLHSTIAGRCSVAPSRTAGGSHIGSKSRRSGIGQLNEKLQALAGQVAERLPCRDGRTVEKLRQAVGVTTRGLVDRGLLLAARLHRCRTCEKL